jgi:PPK2 family polyphosphate:nucleotide phosphotransferase
VAKHAIDIDQFRVLPGRRLALERHDPANTFPFDVKSGTRRLLQRRVRRLYELTELLYAQNRWAVLFIFQALDGAGKDSAIKHVMRGLDPKSTQVYSFRSPSSEELKHDFMWRCMKALPERGRIGIFNRSYYEEVLISRVHPELIEHQRLPKRLVNGHLWQDRYDDIKAIEGYLARNGTVIRKIFLNVSKAEQRRRFLQRLHDPAKKWKFSSATSTNGCDGTNIWPRTRKRCAQPVRLRRRGTSFQPITNGSRGLLLQRS